VADALLNQFQLLRARVESSLKPPYAVVISSALISDGKTVCAQGLADAMAVAGYRTLLVDLDHEDPSIDGLPQPKSLRHAANPDDLERLIVVDQKSGVAVLSLSNAALCQTGSREYVAAFLSLARTRFDAVIVDSARLAVSSIGSLFARESDAVILTTREGRPIRNEDRALIDVIERENLKFFGVVTIARRTINDFALKSFGVPQRSSHAASTPIRAVENGVTSPRLVS
jgi:Mrp family chromosome partitioning ATPase